MQCNLQHENGEFFFCNLFTRVEAVQTVYRKNVLTLVPFPFFNFSNLHHRCHRQIPPPSRYAASIVVLPENSSVRCRKMRPVSTRKFGLHICKWWNCRRTNRSYRSTRRTSASTTILRRSVLWANPIRRRISRGT